MSVSAALLLDVVILLVLVCCVIMGTRRGFVLTFCSLLSVVIALAGGWYLSTHYAAPLQEKIEPIITQRLLDSASEQELPEDTALPEDTEGNPFLERFSQSIQEQLRQQVEDFRNATIAEVSSSLASIIARSILFLLGFVAIPLVWRVITRALNLVAKLPVLRTLNRLLGGIAGLIKGILILAVARWLFFDLLGLISVETAQASHLLPLLSSLPIFSPF